MKYKSIILLVLTVFIMAGIADVSASDAAIASEDINQTDDVISVEEDTDLAFSEENELTAVEESDSGTGEYFSNQLTIGNIEDNASSISMGKSNSDNVVSNYEGTAIDAINGVDYIIKADDNEYDVLSANPKLDISNTPINPYTSIGEEVTFEISCKNLNDTYDVDDGILKIAFKYNDTQLEYKSLTPNANPDNYDLDQNGNPSFSEYEEKFHDSKGFVVGYKTQKFYYEDSINFTVTFKVLKYGMFQTTAFLWQDEGVNSIARVTSNITNFVVTQTPSSLTMKVGGFVSFSYSVKNEGARYDGNYLGLDIYFDADKMEYLGFIPIQNLNNELIEYSSTHVSGNDLGFADGGVLGADSSVGHLKFGYTSDGGFDEGSGFQFDIHFKSLVAGRLQSDSVIRWNESKYSSRASAYVFSGDPSFKLTETARNQFVNIGEFVAYDIFLENDGTLQYTENDGLIIIEDYYPLGLEYVDGEANEDKGGVKPELHFYNNQSGVPHVQIKFDLNENGMTEGWAPGSTLNVTLYFRVIGDGVLFNRVYSEWHTENVAAVVSGVPEMYLNKKCLNSTVEVGDYVYYEIYLENTGNIDYLEYAPGGTDHLILEDIYPEGLEYVDYMPNADKNGNHWDGNYESVVDYRDNRTVVINYKIGDKWLPGDSLNVTLIFKAVDIGKLTNKARFYWLWDDSVGGSENSINLTDDAVVGVGSPKFSLEKISNYEDANVGDIVSFSIVYSNTGYRTITGAYITDNIYSSGLQYYDYSNEELWTFDGKDTWYYNNKLKPDESVTLTLFFKALTLGKKSNTVSAGHNMNNETLEDTDTVMIKEKVNVTLSIEESGTGPKKKDLKIAAKNKSFKKTAKTKKYKITLRDADGKAVKKAKLTLKVNGKTYNAKTKSNGVAIFKIKLNKDGVFKAVIKYNGNRDYNKLTKKVKITVKPL